MASPINFLLLVELIVVVIVASAFLFYWNRLLGSCLAFFIRLYTWRSLSAYISIGSLQISPLAGRISFRDVEYHSSNLSFRALHGHVTWRYWKLRVRQEADSQSSNLKRKRLPCRIMVYAEGVECFVFNRTPAYDAIVERMKKHEKEAEEAGSRTSDETLAQQKSNGTNATGNGEEGIGFGARLRKVAKSATSGTSQTQETASSSDSHQKPGTDSHTLPLQPKPVKMPAAPGVNWFREALPVELHVVTGSVVLGSDASPSLLIGNFERTDGTLEITDSRSACDEYKLLVNLNFEQATVLLRTNVDYSGPLLAHGKKVYDELLKRERDIAKQPPSKLSSFLGFHALSKRFAFMHNPKFSSPPVAGMPTDRVWKGLARYRVDHDNTAKPAWREEREYAKRTELITASSLEFTYYADTPGLVPSPEEAEIVDESDEFGNVESPPEYGIDIVVHSGKINYGPWADRQRDALQKTFAPSIFFDSEPKPRLQVGDKRIHSNMAVNVQLVDKTSLRIPTREPSKDWEYENKSQDAERRYGWLDVVVGENSSINYTQSQFATKRGYDAILVLHLDSLVISSSVNYLDFLQAQTCKLSMTMPTPLSWNARRDWGLDLTLDSPKISLLRDHVTLISDLAKDWSSGQLGDFHHFVPNHYNFRVTLLKYEFQLCVNDFNIIDHPGHRDANALMDIAGPRMEAYVAVGTTQYRPEFTTIPFTVNVDDAVVKMSVPKWDTHRSFANDVNFEVGKIGHVSAKGSYTYYSTPHPDHQEMLVLHLEGKRVAFKALGWVLRRMFCTKDNYFGAFTNFATSSEFLEKFDHDPQGVGDKVEERYRPGRSDALNVQVTMNVEESLIVMSEQVHGCIRGLAMPVPQLQMALKSVEHFMELSLDALPTYIVATDDMDDSYRLGMAPPIRAKEAVFIEGIELKANRLFGPQPHATTYLCLWELTAPRITAFLSPEFITIIQASVSAVIYNFTDLENAPASFYIPKTPPDVTFFKLGIDEVAVTLFSDNTAVSLSLPDGVNLDTSSWATRSFSSAVGLVIPAIKVHLLEHDTYRRKWASTASIDTALALDVFSAPFGWREKASEQQKFLKREDGPTKRIWYMYQRSGDESDGNHVNMLYLPRPRPRAPEPVEEYLTVSTEKESVVERETSSAHSSSAHTSEDESDAEYTGIVPLQRRSRSFATARETLRSSVGDIGDESDSVSETSISSGSISNDDRKRLEGYDMAGALAERLSMFRSAHEHVVPAFPGWTDDNAPADDCKPIPKHNKTIGDGTVIRIVCKRLDVDVGDRSVQPVMTLVNAMRSVPVSPEIQLDQLVTQHTDTVMADVTRADSKLVDLSFPEVRVKVNNHIDDQRNDIIDVRLRKVYGSVLTVPAHDLGPKSTDIVFGSQCILVTASTMSLARGQMSLLDSADGKRPQVALAPVIEARIDNLQVGYTESIDQQIRAKLAVVDVQTVTAAASCLIDIFRSWESCFAGSPRKEPPSVSPARLVYAIVRKAVASDIGATSPSFRFEGGYELHAEDQRSIRRDPGWIMLARLRHWARQMELDEDMLRQVNVSDDEMATYIVSELARVEEAFCQDESLVVFQPFIKNILGHTAAVPDRSDDRSRRKSTGYFVNLGDFAVKHRERSLESSVIATSVVGLRGATAGVQRSSGVQDEQPYGHLRLLVAVKETHAELQDGLLPAIETLLKLAPKNSTTGPASTVSNMATSSSDRHAARTQSEDLAASMLIVLDVQLEDIQLSVLAGGLRLRLAVKNAQQAVARRQGHRRHAAAEQLVTGSVQMLTHDSVFLCVDSIDLALLQPQEDDDLVANSPDRIVASSKVDNVRSTIDIQTRMEDKRAPTVKVIFGVESVEFDSRPQLRAFLAFARDWQKRHLGNYRPIINDIRALIAKDRKKHEIAPGTAGDETGPAEPDVTLDLSIGRIHLQVRAAKAVWLRWDVGKVYISRRGCTSNVQFGVRIAPQVVGAYTSMKKVKGRDASSIKLPSLTAIGSHKKSRGKPHISATITLGFFVGVLKPAVLDRLLSLHQRLGTDILHIVQEYRETVRKELAERHAKYTSASSALSDTAEKQVGEDSNQKTPPANASDLGVFVDLQVSVAGVRFGLRADDVATTLLFEALSLRGQVNNTHTERAALLWRAKVDHFGLSLGHLGSAQITDDTEPIRKHRSAYMVLDIDVQEIPAHQDVASQLNVSLNRVHTVMHVAALSELSDLVRSWQSDIHVLRDNRATEVAEVKSTTTKILKKLDASDKNATLEESWFASRLFTVNVVGFGIAVPLDEGAAIDLQHRDNIAVPAMLFSTRIISFQNRRNETARFKIQQMAMQFLEKFDQGAPEHFTGDYHPSTNRMLLPSLDCEAQMSSVPEVWSLSAHVSATDFKLSLAPDVVDGVFKLIDLYEAGKDRLAELERQYRAEMAKREALDSVHAKYDENPAPSPARKHQQIVVRMSYTFNSGIVELHRSVDSANVQFANPFGGGSGGSATPRRGCWHDSFVLPTISLWMDYAGPTADTKGDDEADVGTLVFNSAVHESRNTLRPTVLPFFVDLVNRVERRHQRKPRKSSLAAAERKAELVAASVSESTLHVIAPAPGSTIRLRVTLRIDRSELRLSCAPDSNAYVDLKWESGGFMTSCSMGGDELSTIAGSISGVTASLSHEFAERGRSCVEAGAKDMAFSVAYCPGSEGGEKGISVVLDTQLSGQFRLDAFSAWLIFISVWIDNAPKLDVPLRAAIPEAASTSNMAVTAAASQQTVADRNEEQRPKMGVAAIVRFRTIDFDANIAVTRAKLEITPIVLRTISNGEKTAVDLQIGTTKITAKGDISGNLCSDKLVFNTMRRSSRASEETQPTVLSMSIDAGDLRGNLFLGEINILRFHLEPALVTLADDWTTFSEESDCHVSLAFGVKAGQFRGVIRLLAIPRLLGNLYSVLDMVDSQQRIATQRSETFKVTQQRKTDEPSPVAAVILQTARRASAAAGNTAHVCTAQTMRFDLAGIDVGVFNEDYEAGGGGQVADFYRFVVGKVEADLKRSVKDGGLDEYGDVKEIPVRQLGLLVSLIQWDTSDGAKVAAREKSEMSPSELIEMAWKSGHKGIASLPSMTMNMASQELSHPSVLDFDFDLVWGETDGDIGILPNFFEQAVQAFKKLVKGIDEQQLARARRTERLDSKASSEKSRRSSVKEDGKDKPRIPERGVSLEYRPRDPTWADDPPIPKLKQLGESTGEAARFIPRIKSATTELPVLSHRFVTLPLEEGMNLLLKLYEKQLPERV